MRSCPALPGGDIVAKRCWQQMDAKNSGGVDEDPAVLKNDNDDLQ